MMPEDAVSSFLTCFARLQLWVLEVVEIEAVLVNRLVGRYSSQLYKHANFSSFRDQGKHMARALTIMSIAIAILLLVLFAADLAIGFPFQKASQMMDIIFLICAAGLGYISWTTLRDLR